MSVRLTRRKPQKGSSAAALRKWAIIFLAVGIFGRSILQNAVIGIDKLTSEQLLDLMNTDPGIMGAVTASIFCRIMETCAVPLFTFLLIEGFQQTSSYEKYLLRVGGLALVTELPYNLAMGGGLLHLDSRNPVFAMLLCLIMLFFYQRYPRMNVPHILMKSLISLAAFLWCVMLRVDHGTCIVIMAVILWSLRNKTNMRAISGFCASMVCSMLDIYYIGACLAAILLHRYTEERGGQNRIFNYAVYPALLLMIGIAAKFI